MTHPFENRGLGVAPFTLLRCERQEPMAKCDFCGKAIRFRFECQGVDGLVFGVGRDCVNKVERLGSTLREQVEKAFKEEERRALVERVSRVKEKLDADANLLRDQNHPFIKGLCMRDYVEFVFAHGGLKSLPRVCKIVETKTKTTS
jgi:hypothetical protein